MRTEKTIDLALGVGKFGGGLLDDIFDMYANGCKSQRNASQGGNVAKLVTEFLDGLLKTRDLTVE